MKIAVVGLGYVGLPVTIEMAKKFDVTGFDISAKRIKELNDGYDRTNEIDVATLAKSTASFSDDLEEIKGCQFYIVAVPTPIDEHNIPDIRSLKGASQLVGKCLSIGDIVVYESTVYPGATEDVCIPLLEQESGLAIDSDFSVGYSPERINPGDKVHTFANITKVVSATNSHALEQISNIYCSVISAGVHRAPSIKVAEAAKVIENTQRDINIAFINELSIVFDKLDISIWDVLNAARTKWNFLSFEPGLVGGHCIGVDPYYLTYQSEKYGHDPSFILGGRRINESMSAFVVQKIVKYMVKRGISIDHPRVLIMGCTFKEDCPDVRNSKVFDLIMELNDFGFDVVVHDPLADALVVKGEYGIDLLPKLQGDKYNVVLVAVPHTQYRLLTTGEVSDLCAPNSLIFDMKNQLDQVSNRITL